MLLLGFRFTHQIALICQTLWQIVAMGGKCSEIGSSDRPAQTLELREFNQQNWSDRGYSLKGDYPFEINLALTRISGQGRQITPIPN